MSRFVTVEHVDRHEFEADMNNRARYGDKIISAGRTRLGLWWALVEVEDDDD